MERETRGLMAEHAVGLRTTALPRTITPLRANNCDLSVSEHGGEDETEMSPSAWYRD